MSAALEITSTSKDIFEFHSQHGPLPYIPDDVTVVQFFLDNYHPNRPSCHPPLTSSSASSPSPRPDVGLAKDGRKWIVDDDSGRGFTHDQVQVRVDALANAINSRWNIGEDDVVAMFSPNHVDYAITIWAAHRIGAIISPANPSFSVDELVYQLNTTKASLLFVHSSVFKVASEAAKVSGIPADRIVLVDDAKLCGVAGKPLLTVEQLVNEGAKLPPRFVERKLRSGEGKTKVAFLIFSSGTTGRPKAVAIAHYALIANTLQMAATSRINDPSVPHSKQRFRPGDVSLLVVPLYHIYGILINLHFQLFAGCTVIITQKFQFTVMLQNISRYRINNLFLVPPMVVMICKHPAVKQFDLSSIRNIMIGAAPLSGELTRQLVNVLPDVSIFQAYGLTETCCAITMGPTDKRIGTLGSAGQILPGIVARIIKADGTFGQHGDQGELIVQTPASALCYSNNEQATKETFVNGWIRTGDEVVIDKNNDVFVVDRLKEIMKVRGFQVAPAELEGHLLDHPHVSDVCVVGVPDEFSGEVPMAFVVPSSKAKEVMKAGPQGVSEVKKAICKHVSDAKVAYKHLAGGVEFVDTIPKNPSGKLLRRFMRDQAKALKEREKKEKKGPTAKL